MSPLREFLQGYFSGMVEAADVIKANATQIGNECGRASLYGLVLVAVLVAAWGVWAAGIRIAAAARGKKA